MVTTRKVIESLSLAKGGVKRRAPSHNSWM